MITLKETTSPVQNVFGPDGKHFVTASCDGTISLWEVSTGRLVVAFRAPVETSSGGLPRNRKRAGANSSDEAFDELPVVIFITGDFRTRRTVPWRRPKANEVFVRFSPDGRQLLASQGAGLVTVWDTATGKEILVLNEAGNAAVASFTRDVGHGRPGSRRGAVKVWDTQAGREILTYNDPEGARKIPASVRTAGRSSPARPTARPRIRDAETGREILTLNDAFEGGEPTFDFGPDGRRLVSWSADGVVKLWDAETGREIHTFKGQEGTKSTVTFAPGGRRLVWRSTKPLPDDVLVVGAIRRTRPSSPGLTV